MVAFSSKLDFLGSAGDPTVSLDPILVGVSVKRVSIKEITSGDR